MPRYISIANVYSLAVYTVCVVLTYYTMYLSKFEMSTGFDSYMHKLIHCKS